jgi:hypothetical protein
MAGKLSDSLVADLDEAIALARECRAPSAMIAGIIGQAKLLGLIVDRVQVEALVRRPAPDPDARPGVILSEEAWQRRNHSPDRRAGRSAVVFETAASLLICPQTPDAPPSTTGR